MSAIDACRDVKHTLADAMYRFRTRGLGSRPDRKSLVVFYLYADTKKYGRSFRVLEDALDRLHGFDVYLMSIDNFNEAAGLQQLSERQFTAGGDNSQWEFSGWKRGVRLFESLGIRPDYALFVNDSFLNLTNGGQDPYWFRNTFNSISLSSLGRCALGHVHAAPATHAIRGWTAGLFLQTHAFALPYDIVPRLRFTNWSDEELDRLMPAEYSGRWFSDDDRLNDDFKAYLTRYLTCDWHSQRPFNESTWPVLRGKTAAMINERLFTQEILDTGCPVANASRVSIWQGTAQAERISIPPSSVDRIAAAASVPSLV